MRRLGSFLTLTLAFVGCGRGCGGDPADSFIGTWTGIRTLTMSCDGTSNTESSPRQALVTKGTTSDLVRGGLGGERTCPLPLNIKGKRATLVNAVTCTDNTNGTSVTFNTWTLAITGANSANETGSGTFAVPGGSSSCGATFSVTLTR